MKRGAMEMGSIFDTLFGLGNKPVRREVRLRLTVDEDGQPAVETVDGDAVALSPDGSIDRIQIAPDNFYHCGCSSRQPLGGRCGERGCGRVSCAAHAGNCLRCQKPVCLEHSTWLRTSGDEGSTRLCGQCHEAISRRQRQQKAIRFLLKPFVDFDGGDQ